MQIAHQTTSDVTQLSRLPTAEAQSKLSPERLLNSATAGVIVERVGQLRNGLRSEGRQFAREVGDYINRKFEGIATVFLYEETFGTKDRIHWLIHMRSLTDYEALVRMGTNDDEFRSIISGNQVPAEKGGGGWDKMFLDASLHETVLLPQFWGMYGTAAAKQAEVPEVTGDDFLGVPPAHRQCSLPLSAVLHSGNSGIVLHRSAQVRYEFRSEARQFAREISNSINERQKGEVTVFVYEEAFGHADRIHWLIHLKSMASFYAMLKMHAVNEEERHLYVRETISADRGGGNWSRMIVDGSMVDCALTPQHWGMYATQTRNRESGLE
jgi:hypothetical protein